MTKTKINKSLLVSAIFSVLLAACGQPAAPPAPAQPAEVKATEKPAQAAATTGDRAKTLILAMASLPINLDPGISTAGAENRLQRALYEGLVNFKGDSVSEVEGVLAESWSPNADQSVWTFKLRKGVKFSDGTPFNAEAAKAGLKRMVDIGALGNTILRFTSGNIDNITAKDETTLEWKCGYPCPKLPIALGTAYGTFMVSPKAAADNAKTKDGKSDNATEWFTTNAAGTGPYLVESIKPNEAIVFVRNPNYWRGWQDNQFERIVIKNVAEPSTRRALMEKGDADIGEITTAEDYVALRKSGNVRSSDKSLLRINYVAYSQQGKMKDPRVRQALSYVFDYDGYANSVELGTVKRGTSPWPSGMESAVGKSGFQYELNIEKAKQLLTDAGIAPGTEFTFRYAAGPGFYERAAQIMQANLEQIGYKMKIEERDEGAFNELFYSFKPLEQIAANLPDMWGYAWWPDYDDFYNYVNPVFHTRNDKNDGLGNGILYSNAEVDKLIDSSKTESDPVKLKEIYAKMHQILMFDDPAALYFSEPLEAVLIVNSVKGHSFNPIHVETFDFYALRRE
jgi:peptide/nickel transport system substrate-binding protein